MNVKTTVVYYSMSGNTKMTAEKIADTLSAALTEIRPVKEYPSKGFRKFIWGGKSAVMGEKPELEPYGFDTDSEQVILGSPVWASNIAPPLRTFISENGEALKNKRVAVFLCYSGGGADKALSKLKAALGTEGFEAQLALIDPKDRPSPDNDRMISEFCGKLSGDT